MLLEVTDAGKLRQKCSVSMAQVSGSGVEKAVEICNMLAFTVSPLKYRNYGQTFGVALGLRK